MTELTPQVTSELSPWLFYIATAAALLVLILLLRLIWRARKVTAVIFSRIFQVLRFKRHPATIFTGLKALLSDLDTQNDGRYNVPWSIVIGENGSGRSTLVSALANNDKAHPLLALIGRSGHKEAWQILEKGVFVDGQYAGDRKQTLKAVIEDLNTLRSERPIDSIVLTISAHSLINKSKDELHELATHLHSCLWLLQKQLEFVLPIYVVVTHTDSVSGFDTFWAQFPDHQHQMMGWSSPYALEAQFSVEWIHQGFESITRELYRLQASALSSDGDQLNWSEDTSREFVLFPERLKKLKDNLSLLLSEVFDESVYSHGGSVRGFYFTGFSKRMNEPAGLRGVVNEKIFKDINLAKPLRQRFWSRSGRLRRFQRISIWILSALFLSLGLSYLDLRVQIDNQSQAISVLDNIIKQAKRNQQADSETLLKSYEGLERPYCLSEREFFLLLKPMSKIHNSITYANIPYSWFQSEEMQRSIAFISNEAFNKLVFPSFQCWLEKKANHLAADIVTTDDTSVVSAKNDLLQYFDELQFFKSNYDAYNRIRQESLEGKEKTVLSDFYKLAYYIYQTPIPDNLLNKNSTLVSALVAVGYDKEVDLDSSFQTAIAEGIKKRSDHWYELTNTMITQGQLVFNEISTDERIKSGLSHRLDDWLAAFEPEWLGATELNNPCYEVYHPKQLLLQNLREEDKGRGIFETVSNVLASVSVEQCYQYFTHKISQLSVSPIGPLTMQNNGIVQWSEPFQQQLVDIKVLLNEEFSQSSELPIGQCPVVASVATAPIVQSLRYVKEYQVFSEEYLADNTSDSLPEKLGRQLIEQAIRQQMLKALTRPEAAHTMLESVRTLSRDYTQAINELVALVTLYNQLGFNAESTPWFKCVNSTAIAQLNELKHLYLQSTMYLPSLSSDTEGLIYQDTGDKAQVNDFLDGQQITAQRFIDWARPYYEWFESAASNSEFASYSSRYFWRNSINDYDSYTLADNSSSQLARLREFFTNDIKGLSYTNCTQQLETPVALGNDVFSDRRKHIYQDSYAQCESHAGQALLAKYKPIAQAFNQYLAGSFPFSNIGAADLKPEFWLNFSEQYMDDITQLKSDLTHFNEGRWGQVQQFIDHLYRAGTSLNALYVSKKVSPVQLEVEFRQQPLQSRGSDQIVQWQLQTPNASIRFPNGGDQLVWNSGEALSVSLEWAALSQFEPSRDASQIDMSIEQHAAIFTAQGDWALLRMAANHVDRQDTVASRLHWVFDVPVLPKANKQQAVNDLSPYQAQARMSVSLSVKDAQGKGWTPWSLAPIFPQQAPTLW